MVSTDEAPSYIRVANTNQEYYRKNRDLCGKYTYLWLTNCLVKFPRSFHMQKGL